jgi:acetyl-CoA acetyltransferase
MGLSAAIVGFGVASQQGQPGWRAEDYAAEATRHALADAGIGKDRINGLITCKALNGAGGDLAMGRVLGLNPGYSASLDYGTCNFSIHFATMVLASGLADTILLTYGTDQGSTGGDFSRYGNEELHHAMIDPIGTMAAMMFRRYQHLYGVSERDLGSVAVAQRAWARLNPLALQQAPLSIDDYLAQPYYIAPIRGPDLAGFSDGGAALIMTSLEHARDFPHIPVRIAGMAQTAPLRNLQNPNNLERPWMRGIAERALGGAGIGRDDLDLLMIQDPASVWVLQMLEAMGFAEPGGAATMIAAGETSPGGRLPLNTSGGHLSERYMWGWFHIVEIIRQLRAQAGARQIKGAKLAMHASTMAAQKGSATVFEATT